MKYDIKHYEDEIKKYHQELQLYPDSITLKNRLNARLGKWQALLDIVVLAAQNERKPWQESEIELPIKPMPTKDVSSFQQVGDYQFFIGGLVNIWGGLLIERKETSDIYSTIMNRESRERFYRELLRYENDKRFSQMMIMVEGTIQDFLEYSPKFNGKSFNRNHLGANVASRRATIAGIYARGIPILWCGSRAQAVKLYSQLVRQWCIKNYTTILKLEGD